jgi:hypothetical protein
VSAHQCPEVAISFSGRDHGCEKISPPGFIFSGKVQREKMGRLSFFIMASWYHTTCIFSHVYLAEVRQSLFQQISVVEVTTLQRIYL